MNYRDEILECLRIHRAGMPAAEVLHCVGVNINAKDFPLDKIMSAIDMMKELENEGLLERHQSARGQVWRSVRVMVHGKGGGER